MQERNKSLITRYFITLAGQTDRQTGQSVQLHSEDLHAVLRFGSLCIWHKAVSTIKTVNEAAQSERSSSKLSHASFRTQVNPQGMTLYKQTGKATVDESRRPAA